MKTPCRVYLSASDDPWFNLALESRIFHTLDPEQQVLLIFKNRESVVLGRFQNPWIECRMDILEEEKVCLVRRESGGGTVFHDPGNINFSFMSGKAGYDRDSYFNILIAALRRIGIPADRTGRHDITVEGKKVSGSAFRHIADRSYHHCTLLVDSDLTRLSHFLKPAANSLESKGIASVRSEVANLKEFVPSVTAAAVIDEVSAEFLQRYGGAAGAGRDDDRSGDESSIEVVEKGRWARDPCFIKACSELKSWDWIFGKTPPFTQRLSGPFGGGNLEAVIESRHGLIEKVTVVSDVLHPELITAVTEALQNIPYSSKEVQEALRVLKGTEPAEALEGLCKWFAARIL